MCINHLTCNSYYNRKRKERNKQYNGKYILCLETIKFYDLVINILIYLLYFTKYLYHHRAIWLKNRFGLQGLCLFLLLSTKKTSKRFRVRKKRLHVTKSDFPLSCAYREPVIAFTSKNSIKNHTHTTIFPFSP